MYNDFLSNPTRSDFASIDASIASLPRTKTLLNKDVEKAFISHTSAPYKQKVVPGITTSQNIGNMYTASLYGALGSLIDSLDVAELEGKRIGMYSYGSGLAASFYAVRVEGSLREIKDVVKIRERLSGQVVRPCEEYVKALEVSLHFFFL